MEPDQVQKVGKLEATVCPSVAFSKTPTRRAHLRLLGTWASGPFLLTLYRSLCSSLRFGGLFGSFDLKSARLGFPLWRLHRYFKHSVSEFRRGRLRLSAFR